MTQVAQDKFLVWHCMGNCALLAVASVAAFFGGPVGAICATMLAAAISIHAFYAGSSWNQM